MDKLEEYAEGGIPTHNALFIEYESGTEIIPTYKVKMRIQNEEQIKKAICEAFNKNGYNGLR